MRRDESEHESGIQLVHQCVRSLIIVFPSCIRLTSLFAHRRRRRILPSLGTVTVSGGRKQFTPVIAPAPAPAQRLNAVGARLPPHRSTAVQARSAAQPYHAGHPPSASPQAVPYGTGYPPMHGFPSNAGGYPAPSPMMPHAYAAMHPYPQLQPFAGMMHSGRKHQPPPPVQQQKQEDADVSRTLSRSRPVTASSRHSGC